MHHFSLFVSISMASYTDQQVPFRCCHCEYVGRSRDALRHHISTTHLDTYILSSERRQVTLTREHGVFRCGICHASTTSTRNLSRHARCYFPVETVGQGTSSVHMDDAPDCSGISDGSVPSSAVRFPPSVESSVAVPIGPLNHEPFLFLNRYNLLYRQEYNLLVCTVCMCALGRGFSSHCQTQHGKTIPTKDIKKIMVTCFAEESVYLKKQQPLLPALDFVPVSDGFKCALCNKYGKVLRHIQDHTKHEHDGNIPAVPCQVQTAKTGCFKSYFGVCPKEITATPSSQAIGSLVKEAMRDVFHCAVPPSENVKQRNVFYVQMGWYPDVGDKFHTINKQALLHIPKEGETNYATKIQLLEIFKESLTAVSSHDLMLQLGVNWAEEMGIPLCSPQTDATVKEYSLSFTCLLFFIENLSITNQLDTTPLSAAQQLLVKEIFCGPKRISVFALIRELLTDKTTSFNECNATLMLYIRFMCYQPHGSLMSVDEVSRLCARVIYLAKLSVLEGVVDCSPDERVIAMETMRQHIKRGNFNVFSCICRVKSLATRVLNSSNRLPTIARISDSEVIIRGISVSLDQIRGAYQEALSKCRAFIETLLLGMSHSFAPSVYDNFSNMTLGFQMMADKNPCLDEQIRSSLLTHILTNEQLRRRFISSRSEDSKVVYCANEAMNYIAIYDDYMSHMVVLIHIGSGMPARATEMETFRIRNGPSTCRNVFYHCGQVFFFSEYSKSRSITRVNSGISRFMDEEATIILLKDLLLIRPLVCSMASFLGLNEGQVYNNDLFVINGQMLKAPGLRNNFCRLFDKLTGGCVITFRDYRQVAKYFANIMLGTASPATNDDSESDDGDEFSYVHSAVAHQFGHSQKTGDIWYGMHTGEMPRLRDHLSHQFKHLSGRWHTLLNGPKRKSTQQDVQYSVHVKRSVAKVSHSNRPLIHIATSPVVSAERSLAANLNHTGEPLINISTEPDVMSSEPGDNGEIVGHSSAESLLQQDLQNQPYVTAKQSADSLQCLQLFYNDTTANFRSCEQGYAIDSVLHTMSNVLAILPTGSRKSLLFFLYAKNYRSLTSVVVVPTFSLQQDLMRRAASHGIPSSDQLGDITGHNLVFVTPEAVTRDGFRDKIISLYMAKQLGKIFIDEAHLYCTESEFRPMFRELPKLAFLPIPMVLTTATAPNWIVDELLKSFIGCVRNPVVIRQPTCRLNIAYSVRSYAQNVSCIVEKCADVIVSYASDDRCIVYVTALKVIPLIKLALDGRAVTCVTYTGQQDREVNTHNFQLWRDGQAKVMIGTSAFGLGVDYSHVRNVICFGLPYSLEDFMQQTGRAGRDGRPSSALLMFDGRTERKKLEGMTEGRAKASFEVEPPLRNRPPQSSGSPSLGGYL